MYANYFIKIGKFSSQLSNGQFSPPINAITKRPKGLTHYQYKLNIFIHHSHRFRLYHGSDILLKMRHILSYIHKYYTKMYKF